MGRVLALGAILALATALAVAMPWVWTFSSTAGIYGIADENGVGIDEGLADEAAIADGDAVVDHEVAARALRPRPSEGVTLRDEIAFYQSRIERRAGDDPLAHRRLAAARLLRFRAFGDESELRAATRHLAALRRSNPADPHVASSLASIHLSRHQFGAALNESVRALEAAGVGATSDLRFRLFDALFAVGRYDEAKALLRLPHDRSTFGYLTRAARLSDRRGDLEGARASMARACDVARSYAQPAAVVAWCLTELAHFEHHGGRPERATRLYLEALDVLPGAPAPVEGLAWLAYAVDEDLALARQLFEHALDLGGHLDLHTVLIEIEAALGEDAAARHRRERFVRQVTSDPSRLVLYRIPLIHVLADDPGGVDQALRMAHSEVLERRSAETLDALAWAHFRAGNPRRALAAAREARAWGVPEPRILYRAGVIELTAGDPDVGRSLLRDVEGASAEVGPVIAASARTWRKHGAAVSVQ